MFRVGATFDVEICSFAHLLTEVKLEGRKIGNGAVVHEAVSAENEGVVVDRNDGRPTGGPDMSHQDSSLCIRADGAVVQIVGRRLYAFVHGRS